MLTATKNFFESIFKDAQLVIVFGFTPQVTYVHVDGLYTYAIEEDHDFQEVSSGRWVVIEVLEEGGYKFTYDLMIDADSKPYTFIIENIRDVLRLLSSPSS